jgi:hypothetical protein
VNRHESRIADEEFVPTHSTLNTYGRVRSGRT